jgi:hypothetical protein
MSLKAEKISSNYLREKEFYLHIAFGQQGFIYDMLRE